MQPLLEKQADRTKETGLVAKPVRFQVSAASAARARVVYNFARYLNVNAVAEQSKSFASEARATAIWPGAAPTAAYYR
jgi:hypothetical protein